MNKEVRDIWTGALESGRYEQGHGLLGKVVSSDGKPQYCCLGVLCEVLSIPHVTGTMATSPSVSYSYLGFETSLPPSACQQADLDRGNPVIGIDDNDWAFVLATVTDDEQRDDLASIRENETGKVVSLAALNDAGVPFRVIAQVIRKYL